MDLEDQIRDARTQLDSLTSSSSSLRGVTPAIPPPLPIMLDHRPGAQETVPPTSKILQPSVKHHASASPQHKVEGSRIKQEEEDEREAASGKRKRVRAQVTYS